MSDFKKVENKKKRRNEQTNNPKNTEDQELRNYIVKKLKMNSEEKENVDIVQQKEQQLGIINVTNNGKSKIKKLVSQGMNELNTLKKVTMQAKDKSISKLISVIEIIKQTLGKSNIIQQNHIYNMQDQQCKKQACMKISLIYNPDKGIEVAQN
ncbi:alba protein (macronuclear) [Tetrahymena thermophila SB210]|uniref:Alba protein n=1 Tax=Tetrahymena thermophila (strain SB210) TaxID=312017 RepID=W7X7H5_TETTS|nr:alba protein [Tetrahymena thermophila SB210]EWS73307.1 alba protein [Tetrahymena thermophila SB210]|eukprot:XP_012654156.1 alba protein [Tetrahymena thermophila SB210]